MNGISAFIKVRREPASPLCPPLCKDTVSRLEESPPQNSTVLVP